MRKREYYVYILTNNSKTLYVGVTSDLKKRIFEHKQGTFEGFTRKYKLKYLVYYEQTTDVHADLNREKHIKGWLRIKKINLIEYKNPGWKDLSEDWYK